MLLAVDAMLLAVDANSPDGLLPGYMCTVGVRMLYYIIICHIVLYYIILYCIILWPGLLVFAIIVAVRAHAVLCAELFAPETPAAISSAYE
jgi:hypothetical protein